MNFIASFLLWFFVGLTLAGCQTKPARNDDPRPIKSIVFTGYGRSSYKPDLIKRYADSLTQIGANTASLLITCHSDNINSSNIDCNSFDTPSKAEIIKAAKILKDRGFAINLRVYIDLKDSTWRCLWNPADKNSLFSQLEETLVSYANLAASLNVTSLIIGAEYCHLTKAEHKEKWLKIIAKIRTLYHGAISYGANASNENEAFSEYKKVSFWSELDWIGIDYYFPLNKSQSINYKNLYLHHQTELKKMVRFAQQHKKPLAIIEVGFPIEETGAYEPFSWQLTTPINATYQSLNFKAFFNAYQRYDLSSALFIWRLEPEDFLQDKKSHKAYWMLHPQTQSVIRQFFQ